MQKILQNLAHLDLLSFCKQHNIDPSGSHIVKDGRGFTYSLRTRNNCPIASVTFHHHSVPTHTYYDLTNNN